MDDILDREGRWSIRTTIYRNGRKVATCDTDEWETFDQAAYWIEAGLGTREVELHTPKAHPQSTDQKDTRLGVPTRTEASQA